MKEKDVIKGKELERINNELFDSFSEDEMWIGGYRVTHTGTATYSPSGYDAIVDLDISWEE